jgi:hypothetical protein
MGRIEGISPSHAIDLVATPFGLEGVRYSRGGSYLSMRNALGVGHRFIIPSSRFQAAASRCQGSAVRSAIPAVNWRASDGPALPQTGAPLPSTRSASVGSVAFDRRAL